MITVLKVFLKNFHCGFSLKHARSQKETPKPNQTMSIQVITISECYSRSSQACSVSLEGEDATEFQETKQKQRRMVKNKKDAKGKEIIRRKN